MTARSLRKAVALGAALLLPVLSGQPAGAVVRTDANSTHTRDWACIRWHESGDNYRASGAEYLGGAYQISPYVWQAQLGYRGYPAWASKALQNHAALRLWHYALRVWGDPWHPWQTAVLCGLGAP